MKHSTLMDTDDLEPIIKPKEIDFDTLGIEELKDHIDEYDEYAYEILEDYVTDAVGSYEIYQEFLQERHANDWIDN